MTLKKMVYKVSAKVVRKGVPEFWMRVGTATSLSDGRIIMTLDAIPIHSDGVMVLYPKDMDDTKGVILNNEAHQEE